MRRGIGEARPANSCARLPPSPITSPCGDSPIQADTNRTANRTPMATGITTRALIRSRKPGETKTSAVVLQLQRFCTPRCEAVCLAYSKALHSVRAHPRQRIQAVVLGKCHQQMSLAWPEHFEKISLKYFPTFLNWEVAYLKSGYLVSLRNLDDPAPVGQQPHLAPMGQN